MINRKIRKIAVYCASAPGNTAIYAESAAQLGAMLAERRLELIYGGADAGTMRYLADAALAAGGRVTGIFPEHIPGELLHKNLSETIITHSLAQRKQLMLERSDAFITLPGGFGTLDEFFDALCLRKLGIIRKPCGLLNTAGFYDRLLEFLDHAVAEALLYPADRALIQVAADPAALLDRLEMAAE